MFLEPPSGVDSQRQVLVDAVGGRSWSLARLNADVGRLSERLAAPEKQLYFHFCRNDPGSVLGYLAAVEAGHAVVLLDAEMNATFKRDLLALYKPEVLLSTLEDPDEGSDPFAGLAYAPAETVDDTGLRMRRCQTHCGELLHPDLALLLSTSGSTGSPKLVRLTWGNVEANARSIATSLSLDEGERAISSLPLHYSYGLSVLNSHRLVGGCLVLTGESVLERGFWDRFRREGCTSFAGVPYTYQMLMRIGFEGFPLPMLRTMTQAGGKLTDDLVDRFHKIMTGRGGRFFVMYGATEATARIACLPSGELPRKLGSAGRAIPEGCLKIEVDGVLTTEPGLRGEVVYTGPNVMMGYASTRADLGRGDEEHGSLHTGDIGYLDNEGYLYVTGRAKRFSKLFGLRINLDEVEVLLRRHGPTAVVGTDEKIIAYCQHGGPEEFLRYAQELSSLLKIHHSALEFRRLDKLPLTPNGKIDYRRLQE